MASFSAIAAAHRHRFETPFWRRILLGGIKHMPQSLQMASMPFWASIFYTLVPSARRMVEANLDQVLGPANPLVRHMRSFGVFVNYAQSITNMYALFLGQKLPVDPQVNDEARELLQATLKRGRGVILLTGHLGYWSLGPFVMEKWGITPPAIAMAEEPNAALQRFEEQLRKKWRIVYTTGSPFASLELASILKSGASVAMQFDRPFGEAQVQLPFCGKDAYFPLGPAALARATGALLLPVFMVREGLRGFRVTVEEPIEVARTAQREKDLTQATQRVVRIYEKYVRQHPYQWFNFHDVWNVAATTDVEREHGRRK